MSAVPTSAFPRNPANDQWSILEIIIILNTISQRNRMTVNKGIEEVDNLLITDDAELLRSFLLATSAMKKMKIKTLKRCAQSESDLGNVLYTQEITVITCRALQSQSDLVTSNELTASTKLGASESWREKLSRLIGKTENLNKT